MKPLSLLLGLIPAVCVAADPVKGVSTGHETYVERIGATDVRFTMVAIKGGTFLMGSPKEEACRQLDEGPQRRVRIQPFWMGRHEVTWDEYRQFYRDKPLGVENKDRTARDKEADAVSKPTASYIDETYGFGDAGYPAFNMSHHAAMKYCEWLSKKTGKQYRLPTEAEWEYACRAGTSTAYSFGNEAGEAGDQYFWHSANSRTEENPRGQAHPVGRKKPNTWGLYDMHGNVDEWCLDHYEATRYDALPWERPPLNPVKLPTDKRYSHVARGGNFESAATECRSAVRRASLPKWNRLDPDEPPSVWWLASGGGKVWVGFRVVRAVEEYPALIGLRSKVTKESK
ncbi:formylglycine-generating enzyme family protein [Zavarzinella formosa]|uniref:formylglycine-generating enzyme family protein n=1 Tax=Zavarzinella formosa TaxID=360055 RepID=UPI0004962CA3|nr:SUMF1/EgtB/PvdO family nonheme iron enzyme [Zavarzinella formosa]